MYPSDVGRNEVRTKRSVWRRPLEEVAEVIRLSEEGWSQGRIAEKLGVSQSGISNVLALVRSGHIELPGQG